MTTHPSTIELLEAVARFIEERAKPHLTGRDAFMARVAVNALATVKRDLEQGPASRDAAAGRLAGLLGRGDDLDVLNEDLCDRLASGDLVLQAPGVLAHLKASTLDQVAIDQPNYSGLAALRGDA